MIRPLKSKDKSAFIDYCLLNDIENPEKLFTRILKWGVKCNLDDKGSIYGILILEKTDQKFLVTIRAKNFKVASGLLKQLIWGCKTPLYAKLPAKSPIIKIFTRLGFRIYSDRNADCAELKREFNKKYYFPKKANNHG